MKIKEFIEKLDDDMNIWAVLDIGCCGDYQELGDFELDTNLNVLRLSFREKLAGYRTCQQVADTLDRDEKFLNKGDKK